MGWLLGALGGGGAATGAAEGASTGALGFAGAGALGAGGAAAIPAGTTFAGPGAFSAAEMGAVAGPAGGTAAAPVTLGPGFNLSDVLGGLGTVGQYAQAFPGSSAPGAPSALPGA